MKTPPKFGSGRELLGNGVRLADVPEPVVPPNPVDDSLVLIGVAKLSFWHGFDRVMYGIAAYESERKEKRDVGPDVVFVVVGDGPERAALEQLSDQLSIKHRIRFEGHQIGDSLRKSFLSAHIAVSSLGLHRQNLTLASPLKAREYLGMGLPIVFSHADPDVPDDAEFVFKAPADDSPLTISAIVNWYMQLREKDNLPRQPRQFAEQHLDFAVKTEVYEALLEPSSGQLASSSNSDR